MGTLKLTVATGRDASTLKRDLQTVTASKAMLRRLLNYLESIYGGCETGPSVTINVDDNATAAAITVTLSSVLAGDSLLVNGVSFACVASGATGNQFNVGGSDTITATNLAAAINGSVTAAITGLVTALASGTTVVITMATKGLVGNDYDVECRGSGGLSVAGSGVQASGTLTFNNAGAATDTLTINGVVFTAVASGATGNQWNVAGTAALSAAAAAAAINASASGGISGFIYAVAVGAVVTVKASRIGTFGNEFTVAAGQASITASGARMTGGTDPAVVNFSGGLNDPNSVTLTF